MRRNSLFFAASVRSFVRLKAVVTFFRCNLHSSSRCQSVAVADKETSSFSHLHDEPAVVKLRNFNSIYCVGGFTTGNKTFADSSKDISDLVISFGSLSTGRDDQKNSFSVLRERSGSSSSPTACRKANSEVQQRLKDLQKPALTSIRRSFSDSIMQQQDYSASDLQALNDYYADQAKLELDTKFLQIFNNNQECKAGRSLVKRLLK